MLSQGDRDTLEHALGISTSRRGYASKPYRNFFATDADDPQLLDLTRRGLMVLFRAPARPGDLAIFCVTDAGRAALKVIA